MPPEKTRFWLLTIMHNRFLDRCRAYDRRCRVPLTDAVLDRASLTAPEVRTEAPWEQLGLDAILKHVARMPPHLRKVFNLHLEGLSYGAMAKKLAIPAPTVGTRLLRARRWLRAAVTAELATTH